MIFATGSKSDYNEWAELTGDDSWSYDKMLQYFKKLEKFDGHSIEADPKFRGSDGPVRITDAEYKTPLANDFVTAGTEMGLPPLDYNTDKLTGLSYVQTNQINGERLSTNRAYLHPIKDRKNLFVSMNSHVNKILINSETKTAYGVEFTKQNKPYEVFSKKEVILCAGAVGSPKLLMLSGIGPAEHLKSFNITVLKDAPVGENLMDHIAYGGLTFYINETASIIPTEFFNPTNPAVGSYMTRRDGPISTAFGMEGVGFINVDDPTPENQKPNIELLFGAATLGSDYYLHRNYGITREHYEEFFADTLYRHGYAIWPLLMRPKSRGKILLRSANAKTKPKIIPNYFSDPDDVRVAIEGIRRAIKIHESDPMKKYASRLHNSTIPGCRDKELDSDSYWECALRTYTMSIWHLSGTCKMGRENDTSAVVNSKLQVSIQLRRFPN